jgi:hypothetical protein
MARWLIHQDEPTEASLKDASLSPKEGHCAQNIKYAEKACLDGTARDVYYFST